VRFKSLLVPILVLGFGAAVRAEGPLGDLNGDYQVDRSDLALFAGQWLTLEDANADFNGDGYVDSFDLALLADHWREAKCPIVINELLAHSHDTAPDWIELYNASSAPVHVSGWLLSDNNDDINRYRIADGTVIDPNGYLVLYENLNFGNPLDPGTLTPFRLSENGESVCLYSANDERFPECFMEETFGASETGITFGRYRKSTGTYNFVLLSEPTPGRANAYPLVGPVIINEIMYRPSADGDAEYVELLNISGGPVTLFDFVSLEPWRFTDNAGIEFSFPVDVPVTLGTGEHVLLARDASLVRTIFNVPASARVFQWSSGRLANSSEKIRLLKPGDVDDQGRRYWIEVDRINYSDGSHGQDFPDGIDPWPREADGLGLSLNRRALLRYGNDPNNWEAAIPSPGSAND
jgi:hypothetical protein